ncbi:hypothetical protein J3E74DRAFT_289966 [Bipolaris maydis]|nr:hypothetical protein J3E74DRAFT_289966 [Bipolaris maydis]
MAEPADTTECLSTKALQQIHSLMGEDASFLEHLPVDKIHEAEFEDKRHKRLTSLPRRMLFGQITEGERKGLEVWILPIKTRDENQWPGHRFNLFDRLGNLHSSITIEEAIRLTNAANAFKWLKKHGTMDSNLLRAVIRYYFIVKKVNPPSPWPVDMRFTAELLAACKVAAKSTAAIPANEKKANKTKTPASMPPRPKANMTLPSEDETSLFIPERRRRAATSDAFQTPTPPTGLASGQPTTEPIDEFKRAFQRKMLSKAAPAVPAALAPSTPAPIPSTATASTISINPNIPPPPPSSQPPSTPPTTGSLSSFIPAYRETLTRHSELTAHLRTTRSSIYTAKSQLRDLEAKIQELEAKEKKLKEEIKGVDVEKKRLHDSLTPEKREMFLFGREIWEREGKRARLEEEQSEEGGFLHKPLV